MSVSWGWSLLPWNFVKLIATWLFSITRFIRAGSGWHVATAVVRQLLCCSTIFFILCSKRQRKALTKSLSLRQPPSQTLLSKADDLGVQLETSHRSLIITNDKKLPSASHALTKCITWTSKTQTKRSPKYLVTFCNLLCAPTFTWMILRTGQWFLSLDGVTEHVLEKLAWRPLCLEHLFLCTPSCSVSGHPWHVPLFLEVLWVLSLLISASAGEIELLCSAPRWSLTFSLLRRRMTSWQQNCLVLMSPWLCYCGKTHIIWQLLVRGKKHRWLTVSYLSLLLIFFAYDRWDLDVFF